MEKTIHHGRNIKRFREMFGIKQEALALELNEIYADHGDGHPDREVYPEHREGPWNQKKISLLEGKETVDDKLLEEVAKVLKVPGEAIRNFDEEAAVNIISTNFNSHDTSVMHAHYQPSFNPLDKVELYEALLRSEREKNELLQVMIKK